MKFIMFCGDGEVLVEFNNLRNCGIREEELQRKISIALFRKTISVANKGRARQNAEYLEKVLAEIST